MTRPLYLYKTITEQDPSQTCKKIDGLCGDFKEISKKTYYCLALSLKMLTYSDIQEHDELMHIVDLGVRVWNDLYVTSLLTSKGIYLQASMLLRDAVETMAVCEYLNKCPEQSKTWWKAKTRIERQAFSINALKDKISDGAEWKTIFDVLSAEAHPNSRGVPLYGADKPKFGHNLFLGGFYYPTSIESNYTIQLSLCITFTQLLKQWYKDIFNNNPELCKDIDSLGDEFNKQCV